MDNNLSLFIDDDDIEFVQEEDASTGHLDELFSDRMEPGRLSDATIDALCPKDSFFSVGVEYLTATEHMSRQESFLVSLTAAMIAGSGRFVVKNRRGCILSNASWMFYGLTSSGKDMAINFIKSILPKVLYRQYQDAKEGEIVEDSESFSVISNNGSKQALFESLWEQRSAVAQISEYESQLDSPRTDVTNLESFVLEFFGYHDYYVSNFKNARKKIKKYPLRAPALSSLVAVQPEIFLKKCGLGRLENGAMSRYCFINLDKKSFYTNAPDGIDWGLRRKTLRVILEHIVDSDRVLDYTLDDPDASYPPYLVEIPVSDAAYDFHLAYREVVLEKLKKLGREESLAYIEKYLGEYPYKIAIGLCIGMSSGARKFKIDKKTMQLSAMICSYFAHNLLSIVDELSGSSTNSLILYALRKLDNKFSTPREMRRAHSRLAKAFSAADLKVQCLELVKKGLLVADDTGGKFRAK